MCGIFGFFIYNNNVRVEDLEYRIERMADAQKHRGPDYYDKYSGEGYVLGMNRLSVYDNERYKIPYERNHSVTSFNGEAYSVSGVDVAKLAKFDGDGGVVADILESNLDYPNHGINKINGMFAIATIAKNGNKLIMVRDRAGEKPLYYYDSGDYLIFASEIKSILAFFIHEHEYPKYEHTEDFYYLEGYVNNETPFKEIKAVKPGEIIVVTKGGGLCSSIYWMLSKSGDFAPNMHDNNEVFENFNYLINDSIRLRLSNCASPITSLLSGGVDSTIVTSIAQPAVAFTGEYEDNGYSEGVIPANLCAEFNINHRIVRPSKEDFENYIDEIVWFADTPVTWTAFNLFMMFKSVSLTGSRVCLTGEGADEIFNGYARHLLYLNNWNITKSELWPQYKELIYNYQSDPVTSYLNLTSRGALRSSYSETLYKSLFDYHKNLDNFISAVDFYTSMQILLQMADRMSMRFGIEARSPFLDHRILEFGMNLDCAFKIKNFVGKYILRDFGSRLKNGIDYFHVNKKGFGVPFNKWYGNSGFSRSAYFDMTINKHESIYGNFKNFNNSLLRFSI